jgi:hypothetical protein
MGFNPFCERWPGKPGNPERMRLQRRCSGTLPQSNPNRRGVLSRDLVESQRSQKAEDSSRNPLGDLSIGMSLCDGGVRQSVTPRPDRLSLPRRYRRRRYSRGIPSASRSRGLTIPCLLTYRIVFIMLFVIGICLKMSLVDYKG